MTISNEAIEAGARALHEFNPTFAQDEWDATESDYRDWRKEQATAALTAAAPYIQAAALRDAADDMDWRADRFDRVSDNPKDNDLETIIRYGAYAAVARSSAHRLRARADQLEGETK